MENLTFDRIDGGAARFIDWNSARREGRCYRNNYNLHLPVINENPLRLVESLNRYRSVG